MKLKHYQNSDERTLLTALIVDDAILGRVLQGLGEDLRPFRSKWCNVVAKWCFDYFGRYRKAPRRSILSLFNAYAEGSKDKEAVDLIESFLAGLDRDYRQQVREMDEVHLTDVASTYFDKVRMERLCSQMQEALDRNDVEEARKELLSHERVDLSSRTWTDVFTKEAILHACNQEREEPVVRFPGDLDVFLTPFFVRNAFIAFAGPDKVGKSYWLQEVVWRALRQKRRILYYVLGDMSLEDVQERIYSRMLRRPWKGKEGGGLKIHVPIRLSVHDRAPSIKWETEFRKEIRSDPKAIWRAVKDLKTLTASSESKLRLRVEGGKMLSAGDIEQEVKRAIEAGWAPDVVVIDYADELAAEPHTRSMDRRDQIEANWSTLRRVSLKQNCLVVTATQTSRKAYKDRWVITKDDFSEDKRKNAIVSGMIGINQVEGKNGQEGEKERGICRLNWVLLRKGHWVGSRVVWCAGNLSIACPCIVSTF